MASRKARALARVSAIRRRGGATLRPPGPPALLPTELLEGGDPYVDGVPQSARLGPRLCHPDQVRRYHAADVLRPGVADAGELALLHPDHGPDYRHVAVLGGGNLQELRLDAPESPAMRLLQEARVQDETLALSLDHVLLTHGCTSSGAVHRRYLH